MISPNEILKFFITIAGSMILFLSIITLLSIIVGGFVVANLFLISVQDRISEIGIRRTFGAKKLIYLCSLFWDTYIIYFRWIIWIYYRYICCPFFKGIWAFWNKNFTYNICFSYHINNFNIYYFWFCTCKKSC